ncbi:type VI secretion system membrane subunit TssM [Aliikangiella sp. G2MR2-5]|uniref:type VI secretion system membrane subunit TssM n=1 Tax=Aliikangiella sp. G2MR2-5 TaxID=2788943 RepID=UPI0018ABD857|nr:type VI secretion system membrane subunit TssM [Aliikangiella sp. G2MR2-5]
MKTVINFFKNRIVISLIGLLAICILIWFVGPLIKFGESNSAPLESLTARLVAIIVALVLWGLNNLRIQLQNRKNNEEFVQDLAENQKKADSGGSELSQQEQEQISARFSSALETLKKTRFKGLSSGKALYELPWYIIVGPPGSGKTTALVNSSLDFPLANKFGKNALQGVGGTRNCDWWFTDEAVLVDTAGRYTTQDSHKVIDSSGWEAFLALLKKNRRRRPINGAIVAVSLQDLLTQSEEERANHAKIIRNRINELMEKLEIRFPVYLMLTKTDMVSGFSEFFEDLGLEEREQVWGISLPENNRKDKAIDFDEFDGKLKSMLQRLYERVLWRVHQERDINRRGLIYGFPQQMDNLQSIVTSFLRKAFESNRFQSQPYLRGVYFTSGTQDGTPVDKMMTSVASSFGFSRESAHLQAPQGKSYFLGNLFRKVIFPESELVGSNQKYEKLLFWSRKLGFTSMAAVAISFILVWAGSITRHEMLMTEVQEKVEEFNLLEAKRNQWSKDLRVVLPQLNSLYSASLIYDKEENPWLSGLGLYDDNVNESADSAYQSKLRTMFLPRIIDYVASHLAKGHQGGDLYNTFRVYLMFDKVEKMEPSMVIDWFKSSLDERLLGEASIRKQIIKHLENLLSLRQQPSQLNPRLVNNTRNLLLQVPVGQRIYARIRTNPEYNQPVNLLNLFGESVRNFYKIDQRSSQALTIPWMFTVEGYKNIDFSPASDVIQDIMNDRWVLAENKKEKVDFIEDDFDKISEQVKEHYMAEYLQTWKQVYNVLEVADFENIRHATESLAVLTDPVYSPLLAILQVGKENTQLTPPVLDNVPLGNGAATQAVVNKTRLTTGGVNTAGNLAGSLASKLETKVDRQFKSINLLLRESPQRMAPIGLAMQSIQQLHDFMDAIQVAPEPNKQSFEIATARYVSNAPNAITNLRTYAKKMPEPIKSWMNTIADQSWKVVLQSGRSYLNSEWKSRVYQPYSRALANGYPINRKSREELSVIDFNEFFKPNGSIDKFYQEMLKPFINTKTWENKTVDGRSIAISSAVLSQLSRAQQIKNVFFKLDPSTPAISFQMKPESMSKKDARFTMELGGERLTYNHGPKFWKNIKWEAESELNRVRLVFEDLQGEFHSKIYDGPWAWFRLQDEAALEATKTAKLYSVKYHVADSNEKDIPVGKSKHFISYLIKAKSVDNPFSKNLLGAFRCPESI